MRLEPIPIPRVIVGLRREGPASVVVTMDCGHDRHVRHRPPREEFPWVLDEAATRRRISTPIECLRCGQRLLPAEAVAHRRTAVFDAQSVPAGLRRDHRTRAGVWGRVVVLEGDVRLRFDAPLDREVSGSVGAPIVIPPALTHHVRLVGPVRFYVEFLRVAGPEG